MRPLPRLLLGTLALAALLGCSSSTTGGPVQGYLVNGIAVADVNGDGRSDILGMVYTELDGAPTQGYVSTRLRNADGTFVLPTRFGVGVGPSNFVAADVNGDGRPDLVVANIQDKSVTVRLADPANPGMFLPAVVLPTPNHIPLDVTVGDLNGDGMPDIAVAASYDAGSGMGPVPAPTVLVFHQLTPVSPSPTTVLFDTGVTYGVGGEPQAVAVADLNGDGRADLAVATTANTVSVLLQDGAGGLAPSVDYATGVQPAALKAVDLNGDGRIDLLTANFGASTNPGTQGLSVLLQTTTPGTFAAPVHFATGYRAVALAVGDLNGDGAPDVAVACEGLPGDPGAVSVFFQPAPGSGSPLLLQDAVTYGGVWGPMGVAIADMDGDGFADLVLADGDIVVRYNTTATPGTFGPPRFFYH